MQNLYAFVWGGLIATLSGLIGLGGAEFRLPVLIGVFKQRVLLAIVFNLAVSLVTVIFSFIFRAGLGNPAQIIANTDIILNILSGSLIGAYLGVRFASKIDEQILTRIVVGFLLVLSIVLLGHSFILSLPVLAMSTFLRIVVGFLAGLAIGMFSSLLGVAGGELIIPTIVLVFSADIKIAGTLSLAISIPTIVMGLVNYHRRGNLNSMSINTSLIVWMAVGSIIGALIGSYLLQFISSSFLYVLLGLILLVSALRLATQPKTHTVASA